MVDHCCDAMRRQLDWRCDQHDDPYECPDAVVVFVPRFREYGIVVHDGGRSYLHIRYCPWCGRQLPESARDRWFGELEARGIDPSSDDIPAEYTDDRWLSRDRE